MSVTASASGPARSVRAAVACLSVVCLALVGGMGLGSAAASAAPAAPGTPAVASQFPEEGELEEIPGEEGPEGELPVEFPGETQPGEGLDDPVGSEDPDAVPVEPGGEVGGETEPEEYPEGTSEEMEGTDGGAVDRENRRIQLIIAGLVAVALALALLTIRYWRQTKPVMPLDDEEAEDLVDDLDDDGLVEDLEPELTTEMTAVTVPGEENPDEVVDDDDPYADLFEPPAEPARRSRRAVAGADHAEDDLWVRRGTGEHDRIEVDAAPVVTKPTADQRSAAFFAKRDR